MRLRTSTLVTATTAATLWSALLTGTSGAIVQRPVITIASAGALNGGWGNAEAVPGSAALNAGGHASVKSVACASAGDCSAGGQYSDGSGNSQVFVVNETNAIWGNAEEVPNSATLNVGGNAALGSVTCATAGDCSAGGQYSDGSGSFQVFVVNETKGIWGNAEEVPNSATLNAGGNAGINSVSCSSAGNCSAGGYYYDGPGKSQAFVVNETNGKWGNAAEVPNSATLNAGGNAGINSMSCASAGYCSAGGYYYDGSSHHQAFVVSETKGTWGNAAEVPNSATLNAGGSAATSSMSCATAGNCSAGGSYYDGSSHFEAFVANETNGIWGNAEEVPNSQSLNAAGNAGIYSVWCATAGNCSAGGSYRDGAGHYQVFVVNETSGTWANAEEVPNSAKLNAGGNAALNSVACASVGNCSAGGSYRDGAGHYQVFVVNESNGAWGAAELVPHSAALNAGGSAAISSVSCAASGNCSAGGDFTDGSGHTQALVVSYTPPPTVIGLAPASGPIRGGTVVTVQGTNLTGATGVVFGTKAGTQVVVLDVGTLRVTTPAGTGTVDVRVTTPDGTSAATAKARFSYAAPPTVSGLAPKSGPVRGGTVVTVHGTNLTGATRVFFGKKAGTHGAVLNALTLKVTAPAGTGTVDVTVITPGGTSALSAKDRFSYAAPPTVSGVAPASGPVRGGTVVTVHGTNLTGATKVLFGKKAGTHVVVLNAGALKVTAPAGTGKVDVRVTTPGGTSAVTAKDRFYYVAPPTVSGLTPAGGPAGGGTVVTVHGTNLTGATKVLFGKKAGAHVDVLNSGALKVIAPAGSGKVDVRVTTPGGTSAVTTKDRFSYR